MKKLSITILFLFFLLLSCGKPNIISVGSGPDCTTVNCGPTGVINGSTEYIDTPQAYIDATPRVLVGSGDVQINFVSKVSNVTVNALFCFNRTSVNPLSLSYFDQKNISVPQTYVCNGVFNYTLSPKHFWCFSPSNATSNGTLLFDHDFTSGNASNGTAFWNDLVSSDWTRINGSFNKISVNYDGKDTCYSMTGIPLVAGKLYQTKISLFVPAFVPQSFDGKYGVAFYPSSYGNNISGAISDGVFFYLDPIISPTNTTFFDSAETGTATDAAHNWTSGVSYSSSFAYEGTKSITDAGGAVNDFTAKNMSNITYPFSVTMAMAAKGSAGAAGEYARLQLGNATVLNFGTWLYNWGNSGQWQWSDDSGWSVVTNTGITDLNFHLFNVTCLNDSWVTVYADSTLVKNGTPTNTKCIRNNSELRVYMVTHSSGEIFVDVLNVSVKSNAQQPISFTQIPGNVSTKTYYGTIINLQYNITNSSGCNYLNWSTNNSNWGITQNGLMSASGQNASKAGFWAINVSVNDTCGNRIYTILGINATNDSISFSQLIGNITANHNASPNIYAIKINVTSNSANCVFYNFSSNDSTHPIFNISGWLNLTGPNISASGTSFVNITARDNCSNIISLWPSLSWINVTNTPPGLTCGGNTNFRYYRNISLCNTTAVDSDNDPITLSENNSCTAISGTNITYSFTGSEACIGLQNVVIGASDGNINTTTTLNLNITNVSSSLIGYCPGIVRLRFLPNMTLINTTTLLTTQNVLANGTITCTFIINTTGEEGTLRFLAQTNYSNNSYVIQFGNTNLTNTQTLISTVALNTTSMYNVTGYWVNATPSFPIRLSINVTV